MKKISTLIVLNLLIVLLLTPQLISALEITVTPSGQIIFYQGTVLGDDDDSDEDKDEDKSEDEKEDEDEKENREQEEEKDEDEDEDEHRDEIRTRVRTVTPTERKEIRVRTRDDSVEVELRKKSTTSNSDDLFELKELTDDDHLELEFPSIDEDLDDDLDENDREEIKKYRERIIQERNERNEELVELRNRIIEGVNKLEIESRGAQARLSQGTMFNLDPVTNRVTIITPSGQEHTLYHLPDQAILRMQNAGLLSLSDEGEEKEVEIEVGEDGGLIYSAEDIEERRLLGIFPREIPIVVELDDDTGETLSRVVEDRSLLQSLLDRISF